MYGTIFDFYIIVTNKLILSLKMYCFSRELLKNSVLHRKLVIHWFSPLFSINLLKQINIWRQSDVNRVEEKCFL